MTVATRLKKLTGFPTNDRDRMGIRKTSLFESNTGRNMMDPRIAFGLGRRVTEESTSWGDDLKASAVLAMFSRTDRTISIQFDRAFEKFIVFFVFFHIFCEISQTRKPQYKPSFGPIRSPLAPSFLLYPARLSNQHFVGVLLHFGGIDQTLFVSVLGFSFGPFLFLNDFCSQQSLFFQFFYACFLRFSQFEILSSKQKRWRRFFQLGRWCIWFGMVLVFIVFLFVFQK